jgi:hypothetical protein
LYRGDKTTVRNINIGCCRRSSFSGS